VNPPVNRNPTQTGLYVLVIEDDADTRANLKDILELDSHRVSSAASAQEALARTDWPELEVVILDRKLPDGSAESLLPRLKQLAPEADVIVVTGYGDVEGAIHALRKGAADYILKPINPELLRASLARTVDKRRLARAREQSEIAFRTVVETAECLIVMLGADRQLEYFNPFAEETTGYSSAAFHDSTFFEMLIPDAERFEFEQDILATLANGHLRGREAPLLCRDGGERWIIWNARSLLDPDGRDIVFMIGLDITETRQSQQRALQSERLAAIGQMVTGLAHESRNALQRSQACLEMLELEIEDRPEALRLVQRIQEAQDHIHHLYEEVRGYAAPVILRRGQCNMSALIRTTWDHLDVARKGRTIELRELMRTQSIDAPADSHALEQVFRNIFENSFAVCPPTGEISVTYEDADLEGIPALRIRVRDNGSGLTSEQAARLFEPFFTTKTAGTGLGMAIAKRIVEAHAGQIAVGSAESGAEIVITLPCR